MVETLCQSPNNPTLFELRLESLRTIDDEITSFSMTPTARFQQGPKGWWGNRSKRGARRLSILWFSPSAGLDAAARDSLLSHPSHGVWLAGNLRLKMVVGVGFTELIALLGFGCPDLDLVAEFTELGLVTELFTTRWTHRSERAADQPKARATRNSETRFCRSWTSGFLTENPSAGNQAHGFALHQGSRQ
ncbi:hypothetical protein U1Q18_033120 [Sarracenia purpurea var. burkii]